MPQTSIDPVVMAAAAVLRLQIIISRTVAPTEEAVVIMGPLRAGTTENFIVLIDVREPKTVPIVEPNTPHFWLSHGGGYVSTEICKVRTPRRSSQ